MRFTVAQLLLIPAAVSLSLAHPTHAQAVLEKRLTLRVANLPMEAVLAKVEKLTSVRFAYQSAVFAQTPAVSLEATDEPLATVLDRLLAPTGVRYEVLNNRRIILARPAPPANLGASTLGTALPAVEVTGRVVDKDEAGLPGVSIVLKGTTVGTSTDVNGDFRLQLPDATGTLVFSYIGYVSQEVAINNRTSLTVRLEADVNSLEELVVVGYQTQRRSDIVGAVGVIETTEMKQTQVASVGEMLQGRAAGVTVTNSGVPGQGAAVKIRGTNSITGGDNPLYVIDGMFIGNANPDFNPADVESVQILKDAAATALYGSRGMNGVVIITTKRGKTGAPRINFSNYVGVQSIATRLPLMNAAQYRVANAVAYKNAGDPPQQLTAGVDTDWQAAMFKTGVISDNTLTISGGGEKSSYVVSGNYFTQDGTIIGPSFKRYQLRVNTEFQKGILKVGENVMVSRNLTTNINGTPFVEILRMLPTIPVYDPTTTSGYGYGSGANLNNTFGTNPVALQEHNSSRTTNSKVFGSVFAEVAIAKFLTYRLNLGLDYSQQYTKAFQRRGAIRQNAPDNQTTLDDNQVEYFNTLIENTLRYNQTFGQHSLSALVGYTQQKDNSRFVNASTQGITGEFWVQRQGTVGTVTDGQITTRGIASWLGVVNYTFNDKYLVQINGRRDGSSVFPPDNRYATFYSASAAWRISRERFMENLPFINDLKLRVSYGDVGNQAIDPYQIDPTVDRNLNYVLNNAVVLGAANRRRVNPNLRWESKTTANVGLDLALLNNRIILNADYFVARSRNLLLEVPIPLSSGNNGANPLDNLGSIENRGLELALTYQEQRGAFKYSASVNVTSIRNRVLALVPTNGNQPLYGFNQLLRLAVGEPISLYALRTDGIFQTQAEVDASAQRGGPTGAGEIRYVDTDGNGEINFGDRQRMGSPFPTFEYGLNLSASYKGLDFTAFLAGVGGNVIFNEGRWWTGRYDDNQNYRTDEVFWTGPGTSNTVPRPRIGDPTRNPTYQSSRWIEKGDYFRLRNIQLGYTLPAALVARLKGLASLRVYATGQNVFTLTGYKGYNPEITGAFGSNTNLNRGVDVGTVPVPRIFSLGLQVGF